MTIDTDLVDTYGAEDASKIIDIANRMQKKHYGTPDAATTRWAIREYEYQQASKDHGCGYDPDDEQRYLSFYPEVETLTLEEWQRLPKV